ncbi:kinase-like protein [Cylindrobasidium torrendii FP15055 ss-10]|uniref:Kinase-like protein n=1 Tax=Cylindrobasidium torrendii FP15055 ss-10 TaxID=1314674 RepID=A0A0D7B6N9_9AGAR|nr:kinase-like protein [Cylindrobasidium torrendii FP15055 ss-10]
MLSQETPVDGDKDSAFLCYRGGRDSYPESGFEGKPEKVAQVVSDEDDGDRTEDDDSSSEEEDLDEEEGVVSNMESGSRASVAMLSKPTLMVGKPPPSPMQANAPVLARLAGMPSGPNSSTTVTPPTQRYQKWLADAVKPLAEFIDQAVEPRNFYRDLQEIAEGESGSVYAAELYARPEALARLKLPPGVKEQDQENAKKGIKSLVAIKCVSIQPGGNEKLNELERELRLLRVLNGGGGGRGGVGGDAHPHILGMEALYVDLQEDSLWIRMELMERSLADVIGLAEHGLMLQERMMARFASDALEAIQFLHGQNIAHRDLRSDNLLINSQGFLKIAEFSNAVRVTPNLPTCMDQAGVLYWQAPEIRLGPYDPLKVDVWSLGATVWEMAETSPPFSNEGREADAREMSVVLDDRWPPLSNPQLYSPAFQDFLMDCSEPAESRPDPEELAKNAFIHNACGRVVIVQVLSQCMAIERRLQESSS